MVIRVPAQERHFVDLSWIQAYWLFSYGEWYVPGNVRLGKLRVFNDDLVQPREGFGMHPHEELELVTIMLAGQLTITDDARERTIVHAGEVHRISAGTGTRHTEKNQTSDSARYYQIWIFPNEPDLIPSHEQKDFTQVSRQDRLLTVASGRGHPGAVMMHADASIALSAFSPAFSIEYPMTVDQCVLLYVTSGSISLNGTLLEQGDQGRVSMEPKVLSLASATGGSFVLVDVAA
ncbi:MAG: pirin family protein [Caldiserica bacterium]|nr:pirin family protein [Caldisericota bacterium]